MLIVADKPTNKEKDYCKKGHDDDLIVRTLLKKELLNDIILHAMDVDNDLFFRSIDVDLILYNNNNTIKTVEIKADGFPAIRNNTKYVFLELISNSQKYRESNGQDGLGCILTSKSDYFIFYFILYDYYLIINSQLLKNYIIENKDKYEEKTANTWSPNNKTIWYHSSGRLVPIADLIQIGAIVKRSRYKYSDVKKQLNL